eukprot:TRINITY_DN10976_c0_g2_i1.p1 TRINITY_DN10976_c0_g2~~TRINITY_DN10976_c0_g2_i1.p1  ORF type:complete len:335 (-),score=55.07 TRINITY_DN10976_c0_g2_i1:211-1215(-)
MKRIEGSSLFGWKNLLRQRIHASNQDCESECEMDADREDRDVTTWESKADNKQIGLESLDQLKRKRKRYVVDQGQRQVCLGEPPWKLFIKGANNTPDQDSTQSVDETTHFLVNFPASTIGQGIPQESNYLNHSYRKEHKARYEVGQGYLSHARETIHEPLLQDNFEQTLNGDDDDNIDDQFEKPLQRSIENDNTLNLFETEKWAFKNHSSTTNLDTLFVGGLSLQTTEEDLIAFFDCFGKILSARVIRDKVSGSSKGYGFIKFAFPKNAYHACTSNPFPCINGKEVTCVLNGKKRNSEIPQQICQFYPSGLCKYGGKCRNLHVHKPLQEPFKLL